MSTLRPTSKQEYQEWLEESVPAFAADKVASGQWSQEESLELSRKENIKLLPNGLETPENYFFTIVDSEASIVGMIWFAVKTKFDAKIAYVFDVSIKQERRRQGHAKRAFDDLEVEVQKLGLSGIALHVFGHNVAARGLYSKLGYEPTNINLYKPVPRPGA